MSEAPSHQLVSARRVDRRPYLEGLTPREGCRGTAGPASGGGTAPPTAASASADCRRGVRRDAGSLWSSKGSPVRPETCDRRRAESTPNRHPPPPSSSQRCALGRVTKWSTGVQVGGGAKTRSEVGCSWRTESCWGRRGDGSRSRRRRFNAQPSLSLSLSHTHKQDALSFGGCSAIRCIRMAITAPAPSLPRSFPFSFAPSLLPPSLQTLPPISTSPPPVPPISSPSLPPSLPPFPSFLLPNMGEITSPYRPHLLYIQCNLPGPLPLRRLLRRSFLSLTRIDACTVRS